MGKLRWFLWSSIFATYVYMLYMLNRLDTSVTSLVSEQRIMPYDSVKGLKQHSFQSPDEQSEEIIKVANGVKMAGMNHEVYGIGTLQQRNSTNEKLQKSEILQALALGKLTTTKRVLEFVKNWTNAIETSVEITTPVVPLSQTQAFIAPNSHNQVTKHPAENFVSSMSPRHSDAENDTFGRNNKTSNSKNLLQLDNVLQPAQDLQLHSNQTSSVPSQANNANHNLGPGINSTMNYTVDTLGCKIPSLNPFDQSMADLLIKLPPLDCRGKRPPLLFAKDNKIHIDTSAITYYGNVSCRYYKIYRRDDNHASLENKSFPIIGETVVDSEFVKATCHHVNISGKSVAYTDYFPFIIKKPSVENRHNSAKVSSFGQEERFSILLLGLDSTSRNQFVRHFPNTLAYLQKHVTTIDLQGYNKVGSNTYPNMMPLLTGHLVAELPNIEVVHADTLPLIWKNYSQFGYRTQYGEDVPSVTLFNYGKKGFNNTPTDYYLRPYSKLVEGTTFDLTKWGCLGSRLETEVILKWAEDFFDTFPQDPLFSFIFFTRLSHENFTTLSYSDAPVLEFLKHMQEKGHLNRSLVFIFGDHGFRFGTVRNRYIGRLEEKLPAMFIIIPDWFPHRYPQLYGNLKSNEHKLTTPFDIYETFNDLLNFNGKEKKFDVKSRGFSLMSPIPSSRTCADAAIDSQWCSCTSWKSVDIKNERVIQSVAVLIKKINAITHSKRSLCAEVTLDMVMDAHFDRVPMGEAWSKDNSSHYQIVFRVNPSGGVFEGTVWHDDSLKTVSVDGIVDRLNLYGNQSYCVHDASLKPFCYCH